MEDRNLMIPGFRFYPTEEELISFYLHNKLEGHDLRFMDRVIPVLDIYEFSPWDLAQYSGTYCQGDPEQCFFFIPRQESEARGGRPSRLTESGYWKATGSPSLVYSSNNRTIGLKRTMVFYTGRAPHGTKTHWKMNEYKAIKQQQLLQGSHHHHQLIANSSSSSIAPAGATPMLRHEFSLCRVYKKSKCLRAFDRRPTGVGIIINPTINTTHNHHDHYNIHDDDHQQANGPDHLEASTTTSQPGPPPAAVEITSSPDNDSTSSSGGGGGGSGSQKPSQTGESHDQYLNLQMATDVNYEGLWDWDDHLNNFF